MTIQYHVNATIVLTDPVDTHTIATRLQETVTDLMLTRDPDGYDPAYVSVSITTFDVDDTDDDEPEVIAHEDIVGALYSGDEHAA